MARINYGLISQLVSFQDSVNVVVDVT